MKAQSLWLGRDPDAPPIRLGDDRRPTVGRVNLPWLAALVLIGCAAGGLMTAPLLSLSSRGVRTASTQYGAGNAPAASAIVGIRGDRLETEATAAPNVLERRLEHRRLGRADLRSYTFVLARPSLARTISYQDSASGDADGGHSTPPSGLVGLHSAGPIGTPLNVTAVDRSPPVQPEREIVVFQDGDTLEAVLRAARLNNEDAAAAASLLGNQVPDRRVGGGDLVQLEGSRHDDGPAKPWRIAVLRDGVRLAIVALNDQNRYGPVDPAGSATAPPQTATRLDDFSGGNGSQSLRQGLYALADGGQMDRALVDDVVRLCARDVDLGAAASSKDTIAVLYSPVTSDGQSRAELTYLSITAAGREHTFYRFAPDEDGGEARYFDRAGHSTSETLMRKPVAAGRLGDGFGWRTHPVLKDRRFHEGVDYAAPFGSPIVAAGAGVVEKIDEQWGYGKYVRVKHDRGYETTYAHIAGVPAGLQVGSRVRQGQTIAFVGSTGLSTGPHLYYEVRINGRDVDPLRVKLESGPILHGDELTSFDVRKARIDTLVKEASAGGGLEVADTLH